jgi:hypothetical protein
MKTKIPKLAEMNCKYGAPMGMRNSIPSDIETASKLHLRRLEWVDGDYIKNGAYFGGGQGDYIYRATGETEKEQIEVFVRAWNHLGAQLKVKELIPHAKFYR